MSGNFRKWRSVWRGTDQKFGLFYRVIHPDTQGVEGYGAIFQGDGRPVFQVADNGASQFGQCQAQLVGPSCVRFEEEERVTVFESSQHVPVSRSHFARPFCGDSYKVPLFVLFQPHDFCATGLPRDTMGHGQVAFFHFPVPDGPGEAFCGLGGPGKGEHPGHRPVQSLEDAQEDVSGLFSGVFYVLLHPIVGGWFTGFVGY